MTLRRILVALAVLAAPTVVTAAPAGAEWLCVSVRTPTDLGYCQVNPLPSQLPLDPRR